VPIFACLLTPTLLRFSACTCAAADPILTRDQNPFLAGFGLPLPFTSRVEGGPATRADVTLDWSSSATIQVTESEEIVADAETRSTHLMFQHRFSNGLAMRVSVPWIYRGPGVLDAFVEGWHDALGFPQGSRRRLPRNEYLVGYARDAEILSLRREGTQGFGDLAVDFGTSLHESERAAASVWLTVKLPTGDEEDQLGSGAVDAGVTLSGDMRLTERWWLYGQATGLYLGQGEFLPELQRDRLWSGLLGIAWHVAAPVTLKLQVDGHTGAFDGTDIEFLGGATIATLAVDYRVDRWLLSFAVGEDLDVKASPDVNFHFALRRKF